MPDMTFTESRKPAGYYKKLDDDALAYAIQDLRATIEIQEPMAAQDLRTPKLDIYRDELVEAVAEREKRRRMGRMGPASCPCCGRAYP